MHVIELVADNCNVLTAVVNVPLVNVALDAVVEPITPGAANVAPFNEEAFKLATLVVDAITNGAVPVATVDVICPVWDAVVNAPVDGVVAPILILFNADIVEPNATAVAPIVILLFVNPVLGIPVKLVPTNVGAAPLFIF